MKTLRNKVAIVTGASSGIGRVTARFLARRGVRVILAARRAEELAILQREIELEKGVALAIPTDITDVNQIIQLEQEVIATYGRVDMLVNNAGVNCNTLVADTPLAEITHLVQVNLLGAMLATRVVLPGMLKRRQGSIISIASVGGSIAVEPLYSATKFGLRGFSLALRRQLQGTGITISVISPGFIRTPMNAYYKLPMPGPELIARTVVKLATHPCREIIVPFSYVVPIWIEQNIPWIIDRFTDGLGIKLPYFSKVTNETRTQLSCKSISHE
ncbi:SDR family NAD(P)-dependent oxidoreductase [Halotia branconii]|uniref:SDR family oxidoreductase n=1 Tax=Halotia branconii CENA392 TaxID=1539056 RepID=A0AAJ6NRF5_9CYAN|nr:SDR family oxidoreductase [Halotia branconii]WGV25038.1 SDR family oxidoreductase [Halotia branconii CENA392]